MARKSFWAARPFGYAEYSMLDVGQVIDIEVGAQKNDEKLIRLGLLREADRTVPCGKCGAKFVTEGFLNQHGRRLHSSVEGASLSPDAPRGTAEALAGLRALEAADEFAERNIPLDLEKTKASKSGRVASR